MNRHTAPLQPLTHPDLTHKIVQVLQEMDYDVSDESKVTRFLSQAQNVDFGLSAEHEFAAIAAWLGRCRLIHQIGQERFVSLSKAHDVAVPDLLAVVEHKELERAVLIEVKTTKDVPDPSKIFLPFKKGYLDALKRYSDTLGLPVLVAWHPRTFPFWLLFDPFHTPFASERQGFDLFGAMQNDLMCSLLGDVIIHPQANAGITFRLTFNGPKQPTANGYTVKTRLTDVYCHDSNGGRIEEVPEGVLAAVLGTGEERTTEDPAGLTKSFVSLGGSTRAQSILKMLAGQNLKDDERIHWRMVVRELDRFLSRDQLSNDLEQCIGTCIRYIIHQVPRDWPDFFPEEWRRP